LSFIKINLFYRALQFEERKNWRAKINSIGLNESWLQNKPDRTAMEDLMYQEILSAKYMDSLADTDQASQVNCAYCKHILVHQKMVTSNNYLKCKFPAF